MPTGLFQRIVQTVDQIVTGKGRVDEALFDDLEETLIQADMNVHTAALVLAAVRQGVRSERLAGPDEVMARLKQQLVELLERPCDGRQPAMTISAIAPTVYLMVGVNGVGKTTTLAKLADMLQRQGNRVVLAAGDTFRAAAIDQLEIWAKRTGTDIVKHRDGADPSAVVFDAIKAARAREADYVLADTAGRLHTRGNLMDELKKICRVTERELGRPADEILLVLDATTGQNGISQAKKFLAAVPVTGLVVAKLDGTAKGGIAMTVTDELKLPIKLVGVGEKPGDLRLFSPRSYIDGLFA